MSVRFKKKSNFIKGHSSHIFENSNPHMISLREVDHHHPIVPQVSTSSADHWTQLWV